MLTKTGINRNDAHRTGKRDATADDRIVLPAQRRQQGAVR